MLKLLIINILLFICVGCSVDPQHIQAADKFSNRFRNEIEKKYHLHCYGYGGAMMNNIKQISFSFTSPEKVDIARARYIFVDITEKYLQEINNDMSVRPYLDQYPLPIEGLDLMISFDETVDYSSDTQAVTFMFLSEKGNVVYERWRDETRIGFVTLHKEPYSEAYKKVFGEPRTDVSKNLTLEYVCN